MEILVIYLAIINLFGLYVMWTDKRKAKKNKWRIPEKVLFGVALLGGALGTTIGMHWFRHKTQHWYFKFGMPAILLVWLVAFIWLLSTR